jgi:TIR domain
MSGHAFVSYSRTDTTYVGVLIDWLTSHGVPVWSDSRIVYGSQWPVAVREAVDQAAVVVVVMSPEAEASEWVDRELARAELRGIPVVPVLLAGYPFFRLGSTQYEDVRGGSVPGDAFAVHLRALCHPTGLPSEQSASAIKISDERDTVFPRAEPFIAQLIALLRSLTTRDQGFLVLDRPNESGYFAQAYFDRASSSFGLEYRDGEPEVLYVAMTGDVQVAATVLAGWVDRIEGWSLPLEWEPVPIS